MSRDSQKRVLEKSKSDAVLLRASLTRQGQEEQAARRQEQQRLREARSVEALHRKEVAVERHGEELERARLARLAPCLPCLPRLLCGSYSTHPQCHMHHLSHTLTSGLSG